MAVSTMEGASFNLLQSTQAPKLTPILLESSVALSPYLKRLSPSSVVTLDFETTGLDVLAPDFKIVGVGIAANEFPEGIYFPFTYSRYDQARMIQLITYPLVAHNVSYDGRVLEDYFRKTVPDYSPMSIFPWINDTRNMFKAVANEGYAGQNWSLKTAQVDVLGWTETNEIELDNWLIENGYVKTKNKPDKSKMSLAPHSILGPYCGWDAQSTLYLYNHIASYYNEFPDMKDILEQEMMVLTELEIEEYFHGLYVNEALLDKRIAGVELAMVDLKDEFRYRSDATSHIQLYNAITVTALKDAEPPKFTKTGKVAARWTKWSEKLAISRETEHFNPNSKDQLAWLFYDCMFDTTDVRSVVDWKGDTSYKFTVTINGENHEVDGTPGGKRKVDKKILPKLGRAGQLLTRYNELTKLLGYMTGMKESLRDGLHHTNLKVFGTLTGRCSGTGGVNIQQLPKARDYLDVLTPRPGHVFIQMDVDALEPVVLAELSQDAAMMNLYGPEAKPNDIYLFVGASIPALRDEICKYGYDPYNPTAEAISITKKKAKKFRSICKVLHLSAGYGAGARKIWETLVQSGIDITLDEVKKIRKDYWELFADVVNFQDGLGQEYDINGGWFFNGRGMPVTVASHLTKDNLNRCIQSTGHYNLLTYLKHLQTLRRDNSHLSIIPIVVDFHDETIFEVPIEQADEVMDLFRKTWSLTNEELGGIIPLSGEPEICYSFSDFKCEGGYLVEDIRNELLEVS